MTGSQEIIDCLKMGINAGNLEKQQKDIEKPSHEWEHGDIFKTSTGGIMIYLKFTFGLPRTVCIVGPTGGLVEQDYFNNVLQDAEFLFNIKEKL